MIGPSSGEIWRVGFCWMVYYIEVQLINYQMGKRGRKKAFPGEETVSVHVIIPDVIRERWRYIAQQRGMTMAQWIKEKVDDDFEDHLSGMVK